MASAHESEDPGVLFAVKTPRVGNLVIYICSTIEYLIAEIGFLDVQIDQARPTAI
jgi:hypothetical protein